MKWNLRRRQFDLDKSPLSVFGHTLGAGGGGWGILANSYVWNKGTSVHGTHFRATHHNTNAKERLRSRRTIKTNAWLPARNFWAGVQMPACLPGCAALPPPSGPSALFHFLSAYLASVRLWGRVPTHSSPIDRRSLRLGNPRIAFTTCCCVYTV